MSRDILSNLWDRTPVRNNRVGRPLINGNQQIINNAMNIVKNSTPFNAQHLEQLNELPCLLSSQSLDSRGRPQRSMRVIVDGTPRKINFRAYHITWMAANGPILPDNPPQYSHRCHQPLCVEPTHGVWESDVGNKDRNRCSAHSHIFFQEHMLVLCPHTPCCLTPLTLSTSDSRVVPLHNSQQ
ncbi:hypothetical protein V1505DRAFT_318132 [Lipomyces doorenjongii]